MRSTVRIDYLATEGEAGALPCLLCGVFTVIPSGGTVAKVLPTGDASGLDWKALP